LSLSGKNMGTATMPFTCAPGPELPATTLATMVLRRNPRR
jgi:hypothetical protein